MQYDYSALGKEVNDVEIQAFRREYPHVPRVVLSKTATSIQFALIGVIVVVMLILIGGGNVVGFCIGLIVLLALIAAMRIGAYRRTVYQAELGVRLSRFAADNALSYNPLIENPGYTGMYFLHGKEHKVRHSLTGVLSGGGTYEIANHEMITPNNSVGEQAVGFVRIQLERQMPHILLDALRNNMRSGETSLPVEIRSSQKMRLEGNFNDFFTLYVPQGYERDALHVFTPDLMAVFIEILALNDAEIVDDQLFIYFSQPFNFETSDDLSEVLKVLDAIGDRAVRGTQRYVDTRVSLDRISTLNEPARRLRGTKELNVYVAMGVVGAFFVIAMVVRGLLEL